MLNDVEVSSLSAGAIAAIPGQSVDHRLLIGVGNTTESGIVADSSVFGEFNSTTALVLKQGSAPLVDSSSAVGGFALNWGVWEATSDIPATLFTNFDDASATIDITGSIVVIHTTPTDISTLTGKKKFETISEFLIRTSGFQSNTINSVTGSFIVDLENGSLSEGTVEICLGSSVCDPSQFGESYWGFHFAGTVGDGTSLDTSFTNSSSAGGVASTIRAESTGKFLGDSAEGFVLSFTTALGTGIDDDAATTDTATAPDKFVNGAVLFVDPIDVVTTIDLSSINRLGFALFIPESSGSVPSSSSDGFYFGGATETSFSNPAFTNSTATFTNTELPAQFGGLLQDNAIVHVLKTEVGGFDLDWGIWTSTAASPASNFPNVFDSTQEQGLGGIVFASATPTDIFTSSGSTHFTVSNSLTSVKHDGDSVSEVFGAFDLDLANARINNLRVEVCLGGTSCLDASTVLLSNLTNNVGISSTGQFSLDTDFDGKVFNNSENSEGAFTGTFQGIFLGDSAVGFGFAAGFRWLEKTSVFDQILGSGDPADLIDGALLFTQANSTVSQGLSSAELDSVSRVGTVASEGKKIRFGAASDFVSDGALFAEGIIPETLPLNGTEDFKFLRLSELEPTIFHSNVGGFDLQWGLWDDSAGTALSVAQYRSGLGARITDTDVTTVIAASAKVTDLNSIFGQKQFDSVSNHLIAASGFADNTVTSVSGSFAVDFNTGVLSDGLAIVCIGSGACESNQYGENFWPLFFRGNIAFGAVESELYSTGTEPGGQNAAVRADSIGHFLGENADGFVLSFVSTRGTGADSDSAFQNSLDNPDRTVRGAILFGGSAAAPLTLPEPSIESYEIDWGAWDNPLDENWVVVKPVDENLTTLSTSEYLANVNPTPIANMQGSAVYNTSTASSFIGGGSAGALSQLVAEMGVDFDTGVISNGNLMVEVAGSQVWDLEFEGAVAGGNVDLKMTSGQLSNFGNVLSNSIGADLGGVFTGNNAGAFVGGFDLVDQVNSLNQVNGIYTIER